MKKAIKTALYRCGILPFYHRLRNGRHLTIVMFHRVLPSERLREGDADLEWSISENFFEQCLQFFRRHYHLIGVDTLIDAIQGRAKLPARPLLITFDDGWADTREYAAPILQRLQIPAVVFVVAGALGGELWQDMLRRLWRRGVLTSEHCMGMLPEPNSNEAGRKRPLDALIEYLSKMTPDVRKAKLDEMLGTLGEHEQAAIVSPAQLRLLQAAGCGIGSHGLTHTSMTAAPDPLQEIVDSRAAIAGWLGTEPVALSFPNGRYNVELVSKAWAAGYLCAFTSDPHLNRMPQQPVSTLLLGRIHIPETTLGDAHGRLRPELLATHLFLRPVAEAGYSA